MIAEQEMVDVSREVAVDGPHASAASRDRVQKHQTDVDQIQCDDPDDHRSPTTPQKNRSCREIADRDPLQGACELQVALKSEVRERSSREDERLERQAACEEEYRSLQRVLEERCLALVTLQVCGRR